MARRSKHLTQELLDQWLAELARTGRPRTAAIHVGLDYDTIRRRATRDDELTARIEAANETYNESLEAEVHRRGVEGIDKPIFYKGERVDTVREFSDFLLAFAVKARMPRYRERAIEAQVQAGGVLIVNAPAASAEDWERKFRAAGPEDP